MTLPRPWLGYALATTVFWGVWGALIEIPEKAGFPATLGYSIWALTMIPCAVLALRWQRTTIERDSRSIALGLGAGLFGAGGQLILFEALRTGPAYIVFPFVSLYPALTIVLSLWLLRERARPKAWAGILLALPAVALLSYVAADDSLVQGYTWLVLAVAVFALWGAQAYILKLANATMSAEGIFAYMAASAVLLVPVALWMTDFSRPITWGFKGPYLAALIHVLNAVGALMLVYALRWGKAIIVVPMTALAPVLTIVLSLMIYGRVPLPAQVVGLVLATLAIFLMSE
ncbi:MAG TPA: DMT family transporter [Steroidobacteraceae bacterium]|nr:DMT family transporter [Steroidobacteraceae bacterium]